MEQEPVTPTAEDRPQPDGSDIRKMTAADVEGVARSLAQAFYDDPHMAWIFRDDAARLGLLERGFALYMERIWLKQDECYTHQRLSGAALWMPPDTWKMSVLAQLALLPAMVTTVRGNVPRLLKVINFMEKRHPHEPAWYLPMIGVATAWQGRGYGAALLRPVLERCDAERVPAYLEASTARNRALYERNGFEVLDEVSYADDGPPMWRMWREPVAAA